MHLDPLKNKSADSLTQRIIRASWRIFLLLIWASWWGGLCFYAVVVVPIGTELIGSVEQGFITQRVTQWHNALTGLFLVLLLIEAIRRRSRRLWIVGAMLAVTDIALVICHAKLTGMMDFKQQTVPDSFYDQHAVYLWLIACEWLLGIAMPIWIVPIAAEIKLQSCDRLDRRFVKKVESTHDAMISNKSAQ